MDLVQGSLRDQAARTGDTRQRLEVGIQAPAAWSAVGPPAVGLQLWTPCLHVQHTSRQAHFLVLTHEAGALSLRSHLGLLVIGRG